MDEIPASCHFVVLLFQFAPEGTFGLLDWEPGNFHYLETACAMFFAISSDDTGRAFLLNDKKKMLFNELNRELEMIINAATTSNGSQWAPLVAKCAFKPSNCVQTMTREYFTLLGRWIATAGGKELMDTSATNTITRR